LTSFRVTNRVTRSATAAARKSSKTTPDQRHAAVLREVLDLSRDDIDELIRLKAIVAKD